MRHGAWLNIAPVNCLDISIMTDILLNYGPHIEVEPCRSLAVVGAPPICSAPVALCYRELSKNWSFGVSKGSHAKAKPRHDSLRNAENPILRQFSDIMHVERTCIYTVRVSIC